jgi:hypothetical protein
MRHVCALALILGLSGCGYNTWSSLPFMGGSDPNRPLGESENMNRVLGAVYTPRPITTEPGDIWPGPLPPAPTLKDLEATGGLTSQPEAPVPGSPLSRGITGPSPSPNPSTGSSTPPSSTGLPGLATPQPAPPRSTYASPPTPAPGRAPGGQIIQTPEGPTVTTGGGSNYQTTTSPGGGQSIVVPNGNGTSTVIHADGRIETIPTPK